MAPLADYKMPAQCTPEALAAITTSVIEVPKLSYALHGDSMQAYGMWVNRPEGNVILILRGLPEGLRAEVLEHERCHELMYRVTGNAEWHG